MGTWRQSLNSRGAAATLAVLAAATHASAEEAGPPPGPAERLATLSEIADDPGTGDFPAIKYVDDNLPSHTIYRPADLDAVPDELPILVWGNGACSGDGASARLHLLEIASHGYFVISLGVPLNGPGAPPPDPNANHFNATTSTQMTEAIDWAIARNVDDSSPLSGKLAVDAVAVAGHSCGGLQAIQSAKDPRVDTAIVMNSGIYNDERPGRSGIALKKAYLDTLHASMLYVLGGPTDIAYENGMEDFRRLKLPAVLINLDVGHGGTFWEPNGGKAAAIAVRWLDWRLKGDDDAAKMFTGDRCGYCTDPDVSLERKNLE